MKISEIKSKVYSVLEVKSTPELKKQYPALIKDKDLRFKKSWENILSEVSEDELISEDLTLEDIEQSDLVLKDSFFKIHRLSGMKDQDIEIAWKRICLEAQFSDVIIE